MRRSSACLSQSNPRQMNPFGVAHRKIDDLALPETDECVARRKLESIGQLTLFTHDVVYRAAGDRLRRNRANPEIAVGIGACRALRDRWSVIRQLEGGDDVDLAHLRR